MEGKFIIIDGIDGSGKGEILTVIKKNFAVFDLRNYTKEKNRLPNLSDIKEDIILSSEPTYSSVGKTIREELLAGHNKYSAKTTAHAFALDREILYNNIIIPARKAKKTIIQERGIVSSLVYQPVQKEQLTLRELINIPGNALAIRNAPDFLIIVKASPEMISSRRQEPEGMFDNLFFQRKIEARFESDWLKKIFERFGTRVLTLDGNCSLSDLKERGMNLIKNYCFEGQKTLFDHPNL